MSRNRDFVLPHYLVRLRERRLSWREEEKYKKMIDIKLRALGRWGAGAE